jgi:hypothetical protein
MTEKEKIINKALEILQENSDGLRYTVLQQRIKEKIPDVQLNTINGTIWNLDSRKPDLVYKPSRGLYKLVQFRDSVVEGLENRIPDTNPNSLREENFYESFSDWLNNELEECTKSIPLGGKLFKTKWTTPDVIGIKKPKENDIIKPDIEIISVEIKLSTTELITAFGQACSYKLFSHKVYIVIPESSPTEDKDKLDSLCKIFGIGLIFFNKDSVENPSYQIRNRAIKHEPDIYYSNAYLKLCPDELFE